MFLFTKPSSTEIQQFLLDSSDDKFSYSEIRATLTDAPPGYVVDRNRIKIGEGSEAFEKAKDAVRSWKMFDLSWLELHSTETPLEIGRNVAIVASHYGFYSINAARIVYTFDETGEELEVERFGFAYGTLIEHGEIGEERFSVEFHRSTGEVFYDLFAFSRPASLFVQIGYPIARNLQKTFAEESKMAMLRAVSAPPSRR